MIGGNMGMSYIVNNTGASPLAGPTGAAGNTAEFTGESPFLKMMSQMMANSSGLQSATTIPTESGTAPYSEKHSESNGIIQLLGGMIFGSAGQAKLNMQSATNAAAGTEDPGQAGDNDPGKLMSDSLDSLLAMFEGPVYAYLAANPGSENSEKIALDADALRALIGAVDTKGSNTGELANTPMVSAQVISETEFGDGTRTVLAVINGKTLEFSGQLKGSEPSANAAAGAQMPVAGKSEADGPITVKDIIAMLNNKSKENPGKVKLAMENSSSGEGMKNSAAQQMSTTEAHGIRQSGFDELSSQEASSAQKGQHENRADSIESSLKSTAYQSLVQNTARNDAPEAAQLSQPAGTPEAYSQIREEILSKLEQKGPTEFKMQLKPEDLGQIDIKLKLSEGKLIIDILAADARTQALLTSQVDKLVSSMGLQNVQVESVQVSQQMSAQTQDNSQNQGFTMNSAMDFSQKRQQEQNRQEILNSGNPAGIFSQKQDEAKTNDTMNPIESIRFDNYRMNYSV